MTIAAHCCVNSVNRDQAAALIRLSLDVNKTLAKEVAGQGQSELLKDVDVAVMSARGWSAMATVLSYPAVASLEQAKSIVEIFTSNLSAPPHYKAFESLFSLFARRQDEIKKLSFNDLYGLTWFVMEFYRHEK